MLITSMAACSSQPVPSNKGRATNSSSSSSPAPSEQTGGTLEGPSGLSGLVPSADAVSESPEAQLQPISDVLLGSYTQDANQSPYWVSDWCHYFVGTDNVTYGDSCLRAALNADGTASSDLFLIYQYDPTKMDNLGTLVMQLYTGYPGYTTYRDLTNSLFNQVEWAAFPTGIANLTANTYMVSFLDGNGQLVWYSTQQIIDMAATARANANIPQATVPAWDPSITVWSYAMISSINNTLATIPGAAY
ncbi:hypothetical protein H7100_03005 [Candidatus Saccharibacteria bacterium]|nr:hypothetical protein [Candidatus Saccharibacteria bacterium]